MAVRVPRNLLTNSQRQRIKDRIRLRYNALLVELLGDNSVSKSALVELKKSGLYRPQRVDIVRHAFAFGKESLFNKSVLQMRGREFDKYLVEKGVIFTDAEREASDLLRRSFAAYIEALSSSMRVRLDQSLIKADRSLRVKIAQQQRRALFLELERRKALAELAKDLGAITKEMLGNASRVVVTETNNAFQDGRAQEIIQKSARQGLDDPLVFKQPRSDACDECVAAYLEADGITPRLFRLGELSENGSNVGKSHKARLPVIESHHPWCSCSLFWMPPGYEFDARGRLAYRGTT